MPASCSALTIVAEVVHRRQRRVRRGVAAKRREEGNRRVAPVIRLGAERLVLRIELLDGQQFDRGHAQFLQIGDFLDQPAYTCRAVPA